MTDYECISEALGRALKMRYTRMVTAEIFMPPENCSQRLTFYAAPAVSIPLTGEQPQYFYRNGLWQRFVCEPGTVMHYPRMCYVGSTAEMYRTENFGMILHPEFLRLIYGRKAEPEHAGGLMAHVHVSSLRQSTRTLMEALSQLGISGDSDAMAVHILPLLLRAVATDLETYRRSRLEVSEELYWKICSYVRDNFAFIGTRTEVADHFHISEVYLSKLFRRYGGGESFNEYLNHIRLETAVQLLQHSDISCRELALRCGYTSGSYFIRCFRNRFNCTPLYYRKLHEK
ncbi:MAG: helix-turn-helix transcriptional regulator [Lentisphaeria bacterium]|nr:helix-turn-helix transcriptional regulator [Lentisphaeria bacterium]